MPPPLTVAAPPETPAAYEQENVHAIYNQIATHFSATRYKPWPTIDTFLRSIPPGSVGLDAGCGNGKYLPAWDSLGGGRLMIGLDRSDNLVALAQRVGFIGDEEPTADGKEAKSDDGRRREVMVADVLDLGGIRLGSMDFAISIATLHHLSTPSRRLATVVTFLRALRPSHSRGIIHVWALEQGPDTRRVVPEGGKAQDVFVPWVLSKEAPKTVKEALGPGGQKPKKKDKATKKAEREAREMKVAAISSVATAPPVSSSSSEPGPSTTVDDTVAPPAPSTPPRVYQRYYHLFKENELADLIAEACAVAGIVFYNSKHVEGEEPKEGGEADKPWCRIVQDGWDKDNWFCEIQMGLGIV